MRVLVLSNLYPPDALGGYEMSCHDVMSRWVEAGHQIEVLTTGRARAATDTTTDREGPDTDGVVVRRELESYWSDHEFQRPAPRRRLTMERRNHRRLRRALEEFRPTVVSLWGMGGMSLSLVEAVRRQGLPLVLCVCDDWPVYGPEVDGWISAWSKRRVLARAIHPLVGVPTLLPARLDEAVGLYVSEWTKTSARDRAVTLVPEHVAVVGSGIEPRDFPIRAPADRPWSWQLLAVGRIEPRKGFDVAIRTLAMLPEARLRIVGAADPGHLDSLLALATELGVDDRLDVGILPRNELLDAYASADVVLFPPRWEEPFGLVPIEAMSQRTPVVATARGGASEFLSDENNCLVVSHDDPAAIAAAVSRLARNPSLRRRVIDGGVATAGFWTIDRLADVMAGWHQAAEAGTAGRYAGAE